MIVRSHYNKNLRHYSHFVACPDLRVAAIIDPIAEDLEHYAVAAERTGSRVLYALVTRANTEDGASRRALRDRFGATWVTPEDALAVRETERSVSVGDTIALGRLEIHTIANTPPAGPDVAYRVGDALFTGWAVIRAADGDVGVPAESDDLLERAAAHVRDLLIAKKLTNKEGLFAERYLKLLNQLGRPPSAHELCDEGEGLDRGTVHVLVHGVRRKQVTEGQVPIMLRGQMNKWLRGLQGEPAFTSHEREFLTAYLDFVGAERREPTGPELLRRMPGRDSIQWVRKRAHTIRRKQAEYGKPPLGMARELRSQT